MIPLEAACIGYKVKEAAAHEARGSIHSVFRTVVNMSLNGDIYSISTGETPRTPYIMTIDEKLAIGIHEGQDVQLKPEGLYLGPRLVVEMLRAAVWKPRSRKGVMKPRLAAISLSGSISAHGREGGMKPLLNLFTETLEEDTPYSSKAKRVVKELINGGLSNESLGSVTDLLGLGPGLTPSGDDLLCGLLSTLHFSRLPSSLSQAKVRLELLVKEEIGRRTNTISGSFLRHYSDGLVDENTDDLITALSKGSLNQMDNAVERLCRIGHSSGTDIAIGVLVALKIMEIEKVEKDYG